MGINGSVIETASDAAGSTFTKKLYGTDAEAIDNYDYNVAKDELLDGEKELYEDGSRPLSSDDDIFNTDRFSTDKFNLFDVASSGAGLGSFAGSAGGTDLLGSATKLVDESALSSAFSGVKAGTEVIDFASAVDNAEALLSEVQVVPGMMFGADKYATVLTGPDAGKYISYDEFVQRGGEQAQNIIASDLPAEELLTDGGGNIFNKFGTFMGNKDALGIGVAPSQILGGISAGLNLKSFIDDPKFSSGLGTIAGVQAMMGAAFNPYLAGAIVVSTLLEGRQDPSNMTGIANLDLGSGEVSSYGMGGDKQNDQNVETADTIATAMTPIANEIAEKYGVTFEGDIEVGLGNRDNMYVSYGNQEEDSTYDNRLTYNPTDGDMNLNKEGSDVFTYRYGDGAGERLVSELTENLTLQAQKAVANGETVVNVNNVSGLAQSEGGYRNSLMSSGEYSDQGADTMLDLALNQSGPDTTGLLGDIFGGYTPVISDDESKFLTKDEESTLIEMGLIDINDAIYDQGDLQYVDSGDPDFVGPLPV